MCVHLEADHSVRNMNQLAAYSTENGAAAVGAWVLLKSRTTQSRRGYSRRGRAEQSVSWEVQTQAGKDRQSVPGGER